MKGLDYFNRFKIEYKKYCPYLIKSDYIMLDTIEKELKEKEDLEYEVLKLKAEKKGLITVLNAYKKDRKALEIIRDKFYYDEEAGFTLLKPIAIEEHKLLKEVLKND